MGLGQDSILNDYSFPRLFVDLSSVFFMTIGDVINITGSRFLKKDHRSIEQIIREDKLGKYRAWASDLVRNLNYLGCD